MDCQKRNAPKAIPKYVATRTIFFLFSDLPGCGSPRRIGEFGDGCGVFWTRTRLSPPDGRLGFLRGLRVVIWAGPSIPSGPKSYFHLNS
jgi:hypothetical protein